MYGERVQHRPTPARGPAISVLPFFGVRGGEITLPRRTSGGVQRRESGEVSRAFAFAFASWADMGLDIRKRGFLVKQRFGPVKHLACASAVDGMA